jgi:hypothetical protein
MRGGFNHTGIGEESQALLHLRTRGSMKMFTANQYRAKADEYRGYLNASRSPAEAREFRNLQQTYAVLADNEEWLALNSDKIVSASDNDIVSTSEEKQDKPAVASKHDERTLRCLAAWGV